MDDQGWTTVEKKKKPSGPKPRTSSPAVSPVYTPSSPSGGPTKKFNAGSNKQKSATPANARKLDEDDGNYTVKTVGTIVGNRIAAARAAKGWTQRELATRIQEQFTVVQSYEQGKAVPNQKILSKIERALGTTVRGNQ